MNTSLLLVLASSSALVNLALAVALHIVTPHHHPQSRQTRFALLRRLSRGRSAHYRTRPSRTYSHLSGGSTDGWRDSLRSLATIERTRR